MYQCSHLFVFMLNSLFDIYQWSSMPDVLHTIVSLILHTPSIGFQNCFCVASWFDRCRECELPLTLWALSVVAEESMNFWFHCVRIQTYYVDSINSFSPCVLCQTLEYLTGDQDRDRDGEAATAKRAKNKSKKGSATRAKGSGSGRNRLAAGTGSGSVDDSTQDSTSDSDSFSGTRTSILE